MKIQIKDRWLHDTNSTNGYFGYDKWVTEVYEYEPTLEDAKEWSKGEEAANGQGQLVFIQEVTETSSIDVVDKYVPRIEKEYERLLKEERIASSPYGTDWNPNNLNLPNPFTQLPAGKQARFN